MAEALVVSNIVLWVVVTLLIGVVVALTRQIGVLHERVSPAGALMLPGGPDVGENSPEFALKTLDGNTLHIGGTNDEGFSTLVFFLSPTCPICNTLLPTLRSCNRSEAKWLRIIIASDGERADHTEFVQRQRLEIFPYVLSTELGVRYSIARLPYAILIDASGILRAKGLINSREQLESLFEAQERGIGSLGEWAKAVEDQAKVA